MGGGGYLQNFQKKSLNRHGVTSLSAGCPLIIVTSMFIRSIFDAGSESQYIIGHNYI